MKEKIFTLTILLFIPFFVLADENVEIINNVSASVSAGGNNAESGKIIEGGSRSSVKVYTEVNGEVIEDFQKEIEGSRGINYESKKSFKDGKVEVKVETSQSPKLEDKKVVTSSLEKQVSEAAFDRWQEKVRQVLKYVFYFFKF